MAYIVISKPVSFNKKYDHFQLKPGSFTVTLDLDKKLEALLKKDGLLLEELNEIGQDYYDKYVVKVMENTLSKADSVFELAVQKGAPDSFFKTQIAGLNKTLADNVNAAAKGCELAVLERCDEFRKTKKEYTKYKFKVGLKISLATASLIATIGSLAASGFTMGASTIVSIYGMAKTAANLGQQIAIAYEEAETTLAVVKRSAGKLEKNLNDSIAKRKMAESLLQHPSVVKSVQTDGAGATATAMYAKQIFQYCFSSEKKLAKALETGEIAKGGLSKSAAGKEALANLGTWAFGVSLPSIKTLGEDWETLLSKTKGIEVKSHDFAKKLNDLLDAQEKLDKDFETALKKGKILGTDDEPRFRANYKKLMSRSITKVEDMIERTSRTYQRFKGVNAEIRQLTKHVEIILSLKGKWFDRMDVALEAAGLLMAFSGSNSDMFKSGAKFFEAVGPDLIQTAAEFTVDKIIDKITS